MKNILLLFCLCGLGFSVFAQGSSAPQRTHRLSDTLVIPFAYKQSAIFHKYTLDVLDSVVNILNINPGVTLSLEGYAYVGEGDDTICKYLSLDRALFVRDALLGRGIDSGRISAIKAMGQWKPEKRGKYKINNDVHCRVEILLIYPPPPKPPVINDRDEDGVPDETDACPDEFGYPENHGCPLKDVLFVYFNTGESYLSPGGFKTSDELVAMLRKHPTYTVSIRGHASKTEAVSTTAFQLSNERADIVARYLQSRNIPAGRVETVTAFGNSKPVNAQHTPQQREENSCVEVVINKHELPNP